jgi:hypothetical protein
MTLARAPSSVSGTIALAKHIRLPNTFTFTPKARSTMSVRLIVVVNSVPFPTARATSGGSNSPRIDTSRRSATKNDRSSLENPLVPTRSVRSVRRSSGAHDTPTP